SMMKIAGKEIKLANRDKDPGPPSHPPPKLFGSASRGRGPRIALSSFFAFSPPAVKHPRTPAKQRSALRHPRHWLSFSVRLHHSIDYFIF
ncbi:MAG: hypothetical protein V3571_14675, partial [Pseudodesulfovibrio sp.]